jgi:hypothetical protein
MDEYVLLMSVCDIPADDITTYLEHPDFLKTWGALDIKNTQSVVIAMKAMVAAFIYTLTQPDQTMCVFMDRLGIC